jgi:hypothetical protein
MSAKWIDGKYSFSYLVLGGGMRGSVGYETGGYVGRIFGKETPPQSDVADARKMVEAIAKDVLTKALVKLEAQ